MNRRGFLGTILALSAAPAIVRASSLMPVRAFMPFELLSEEQLRIFNNWTISLFTAVPAFDGDSSIKEVSYKGYERQTVTREQLLEYITFPQCVGGSALVTHVDIENQLGQRKRLPIHYPQAVGTACTLSVKMPSDLDITRLLA